MKSGIKVIKKIVDEHESHLKSISDGIAEGISEGVREGVASGLKNGVKEALKECLIKGFINIGDDDFVDILRKIPEEILKNNVKEGARQIFKKSTEDYLQKVCQKLIERMQKEDIRLSKEQIEDIQTLIKKSEREALSRAVKRLPDNPFLKAVTSGIQKALEENLDKNFQAWEETLQKETENQP